MKKTLQLFSSEQLEISKKLSPTEIVTYLENYRILVTSPNDSPLKLISLKISPQLLAAFKLKCSLENIKYQTKIKELLTEWVISK